MKIEQVTYGPDGGWKTHRSTLAGKAPQFVLAFGGRKLLEDASYFKTLHTRYPQAHIILSSTSGDLTGGGGKDDVRLRVTGVQGFEVGRILEELAATERQHELRRLSGQGAPVRFPATVRSVCHLFDFHRLT